MRAIKNHNIRTVLTVIQQGSTLAARQYAKYGCPPGLRGDLWKLILCYDVDDVVRTNTKSVEWGVAVTSSAYSLKFGNKKYTTTFSNQLN